MGAKQDSHTQRERTNSGHHALFRKPLRKLCSAQPANPGSARSRLACSNNKSRRARRCPFWAQLGYPQNLETGRPSSSAHPLFCTRMSLRAGGEEFSALDPNRFHPVAFLATTSMASYTWTEIRRMFEPIGVERLKYDLELKYGMRDG